MFGLSTLGIIHTAISLVAIVCGIRSFVRYKEILLGNPTGRIYLAATTLTALTALGIYNFNGKFGVGHVLAVLTLLAIAAGTLVGVSGIFGRWTRSLQALCFSSTALFHVVPGVTEALTRLPLGHPLVNREDPSVFVPIYGALFLVYFVCLFLQLRWLWVVSVKPAAEFAAGGLRPPSR